MDILHNTLLRDHYLQQYRIPDMFDTREMHFRLFSYSRGEQIISPYRKMEYMLFLVEGSASLYKLRDDAGISPVAMSEPLSIFGDMEFATGKPGTLFVEAKTEVRCLALSLAEYGEALHRDVRFLNCMLTSLGDKFYYVSHMETEAAVLEEQLLYYMENYCPDHCIYSIQDTTMQLRCSRRQLQRVLKKLCESGQIEKIKKGTYRLQVYDRE